jgi:hypothetical protein
MIDPIDDAGADWGALTPDQMRTLAGQSETFATARRLISALATSAETDDGGTGLAMILHEIANGDPVAVALACATECVQAARQLYGEQTGQVLALRAQRQMSLAERNRQEFGAP